MNVYFPTAHKFGGVETIQSTRHKYGGVEIIQSTRHKFGGVETSFQSVLLLAANHEVGNWDGGLHSDHLVAPCQ